MPIVSMKDITVQYGKNVVIEGLSLDVERGENLAVVGPSSCGKTTLMRALCGFIKISSGEITLNGVTVSSASPRVSVAPEKRNIGVVFQDYAVWPHFTVFENIVYPLRRRKVPKNEAKERAMAAMALVKMAEFADRLPSQLSGGQQQRVALARALVSSSELIVLDEPITNLDAKLREEMAYEIRNLQRTIGVTVIYITHDQETAMTISDRMVIMDRQGYIRQIGAPEDVWNNPADRWVYSFLGVSNFLPVVRGGDGFCLLSAGGGKTPLSLDADPSCRGEKLLMASRPTTVKIFREGEGGGAARGVVERVTYLGHQFDYFVNVGGHTVRVQEDSLEAFDRGVPEEGAPCGVELLTPALYEAEGDDPRFAL
ncbi:MAG: ABC transporter ATP-binding protein [Aminivibrio sp.]|jgi:iron(III) transport system ATP-binding protein